MRYVIIGGSIAGISAAKAIRSLDAVSEIRVISSEKTQPYYRPLVPLLIERGEFEIKFGDNPSEKYGLTTRFDTVTGIDLSAKTIKSASGEHAPFDRLLIATGNRPYVPNIRGLSGDGVFKLRTMHDAMRIKGHIPGCETALVLGGGLAGIKSAISLKKMGLEVTILENRRQILSGRLDRRGSGIIARTLKENGITVLTRDTISEVIRVAGRLRSVKLVSGSEINADMIIVATGSTPDLSLAKTAHILTNRGIVVNESLQTSRPDIYAAGDVVEFEDLVTGLPAVSSVWTNAEEMGRLAGKGMAGEKVKHRGFLSVMNSTNIFGMPMISVGMVEPIDKRFEAITEDNLDSYRKLLFYGDVLVGAIFIGDVVDAGIYASLIRNQVQIGSLKSEAMRGNLGYVNFFTHVPSQSMML